MQKIIFTICFLLFAGLTASSHTYIICVGISDYPGTDDDLNHCAADALTMSRLYQKNGGATVRLLQNEQATAEAVTTAFSQLCSEAGDGDVVIFFFSGHGLPGAFVCHDTLLRYDRVVNALAASSAKQIVIFADACFAGKARRGDRHATADDYAQTSVLFFLSSRTNETSKEYLSMRNGLFTAFLERGLRGGADANRDRVITTRELFQFVSQGVRQRSRQLQHPVMWGRFLDDMPLMTWADN